MSDDERYIDTESEAWKYSYRMHQNPDYLRSLAQHLEDEQMGRRYEAEQPIDIAKYLHECEHPTADQCDARAASLRAKAAEFMSRADELAHRGQELRNETLTTGKPA